MTDEELTNAINILGRKAYLAAHAKGFHEYTPAFGQPGQDTRHILSWLMLITTEVAEAAEEARNGTLEKFGTELADIAIRLFDMAYALEIDLGKAIIEKMYVNRIRPMLHGGKRA